MESIASRSLKPRRHGSLPQRPSDPPPTDPIEMLLAQMLGVQPSRRGGPERSLVHALSLLLPFLRTEAAAGLLAHLGSRTQALVAINIALMERDEPELLAYVTDRLEQRLASPPAGQSGPSLGVQLLSRVLVNAESEIRDAVLDVLGEADSGLAMQARRGAPSLDDLPRLDARSVQLLLSQVDRRELAVAMAGASEEIRHCIFQNQSARSRQLLQDEMEVSARSAPEAIEKARSNIARIAMRLLEAGKITMA